MPRRRAGSQQMSNRLRVYYIDGKFLSQELRISQSSRLTANNIRFPSRYHIYEQSYPEIFPRFSDIQDNRRQDSDFSRVFSYFDESSEKIRELSSALFASHAEHFISTFSSAGISPRGISYIESLLTIYRASHKSALPFALKIFSRDDVRIIAHFTKFYNRFAQTIHTQAEARFVIGQLSVDPNRPWPNR